MRDLRLEKGLSLANLQQAGGLTPSQMSSAERGRVLITMGTVVSVAKALGIPPYLLLALSGDDPLTAVLEEIRQAWAGEMRRAGEDLLARVDERGDGGHGPKGGSKRPPLA